MGFSGNGGRQLPPFTTAHTGQLSWTCDGAHFQLLAALGRNGNVDSQAHKGSTRLAAGKHGLTVNAIGRWTVAWKP
jgi:hypothetical protein